MAGSASSTTPPYMKRGGLDLWSCRRHLGGYAVELGEVLGEQPRQVARLGIVGRWVAPGRARAHELVGHAGDAQRDVQAECRVDVDLGIVELALKRSAHNRARIGQIDALADPGRPTRPAGVEQEHLWAMAQHPLGKDVGVEIRGHSPYAG